MKSSPVIHFEMPAKDKKRVADFYTKVFGWQMQQMGTKMGNYILATTTQSDEKGPKMRGAINGGFFEYMGGKGDQYPHVVISVDNLAESIKALKDAGGDVMGEEMDIPGIGLFIMFKDTEGNKVGILQPSS